MKDIEGLGLVLKPWVSARARPDVLGTVGWELGVNPPGGWLKRETERFRRRLGSAVFATDDVVAFDDRRNTEAGAAIFHTAFDANDFA